MFNPKPNTENDSVPSFPCFSDSIVSDLHKDAYGFRPGPAFAARWNAADQEGRREIWDSLCEDLESEMAREKAEQESAIAEWREDIARIMGTLKWSKKRAIRHDMESHGCDSRDVGFYCYKRGMGYSLERYICRTIGVRYRGC
jgi:hypothetical protein